MFRSPGLCTVSLAPLAHTTSSRCCAAVSGAAISSATSMTGKTRLAATLPGHVVPSDLDEDKLSEICPEMSADCC